MSDQPLSVEIRGQVGLITLQRPESGNTLSDSVMLGALEDALAAFQASAAVAVVVLTGSGGIFSAGGDVKAMRDRTGMFAGEPAQIQENYRGGIQRLTRLIAGLDLVTIAAVNGAAIGAGCDLALMCDLRLAARQARFAQAFVNLGLVPGDGGAWFLARSLPRHLAADMIFTGRTVAADEALRIGLVNEVVDDAGLMGRACELAAIIAAKPPLALRLGKRLLSRADELTLSDFLELSAAYQAMLHQTEAHQAALDAYFAGRARRAGQP
jgi:enoyl-CoA hydratase/carnithine racemase